MNHLHPVPAARPDSWEVSETDRAAGQSLSFALMAAVRHSELGEYKAEITALCDCIWLMHRGEHEPVSDHEVMDSLGRILGAAWVERP